MKLDQLRTLAEIVEAGTFDAAAASLRLTPSAVSQRVKALEAEVGAVLLTRTNPCRPTPAGQELVRLGRQVALLEDQVRTLTAPGGARVDLPVAVTRDSLATWFEPVVAEAAEWPEVTLRLMADDQDLTTGWLRDGTALAAISAHDAPVVGCRATPLGSLRYLACAQDAFVERWGEQGRLDLAQAPMVRFNRDDRLQHLLLERHGLPDEGPQHWVPSTEAMNTAVARGLGWGLVPVAMLPDLARRHPGVLALDEAPVDVPLFWQCATVESAALDRLTSAVLAAAKVGLVS